MCRLNLKLENPFGIFSRSISQLGVFVCSGVEFLQSLPRGTPLQITFVMGYHEELYGQKLFGISDHSSRINLNTCRVFPVQQLFL